MKILVVGGGGREYGLVWAAKKSKGVREVVAAPGNAGIAEIARCVDVPVDDIEGLVNLAKKERPYMVLIGPEVPLTLGLTDRLQAEGMAAFGPSASAARLEGSKTFAKEFMAKYNIPTAKYTVCTNAPDAVKALDDFGIPVVIKADGLAAGKGVTVALTREEAVRAIMDAMTEKIFGDAGERVVIEEYLEGEEASILAFCDGKTVVPVVAAQDHKRIFDNDEGPNTGGMGAYAPAPVVTDALKQQIQEEVLERTMVGMEKEGSPYKGILYAGLMITAQGPKVIEFNCRFGDPETQVVLPLLTVDLIQVAEACLRGKLTPDLVTWADAAAVCVVMSAPGYPGDYPKGLVISGIEEAEKMSDVMVWHAGTRRSNGDWVTSGGRVLGVISVDQTLSKAVEKVYQATEKIKFEGAHFRKDIAYRALTRITDSASK
ncbi:phosphoribosylamine--glycine ligase [bacterium]|nr:phosphoribosylamine--glycine ligase [bacterium]